jgi:hypothetical protein
MNEKIFEALAVLAGKLGTTAEYLWGVMVRQAQVSGIMNLIAAVFLLVGLVVLIRVTVKNWKGWWDQAGEDEYQGALVFCAIIAHMIIIIPLWVCFDAAIYRLINPEYFALAKILSAL